MKAKLTQALPVFRTRQEIADRSERLMRDEPPEFPANELMLYLTRKDAVRLLGAGTVADLGPWVPLPADRESVLNCMEIHLPLAWEKADATMVGTKEDEELPVSWSLERYADWIWLLGDERHFPDLRKVTGSGHAQLLAICRHYGFECKGRDDAGRKVSA